MRATPAPDVPAPGGGEVSQGFMASELICSIFTNVQGSLETMVNESIYGFTEFEHLSPDEAANLDASQYNKIASVAGGLDVNGDELGELIFPSHDENGSPLGALPLQVLTVGDLKETKNFFLQLHSVSEGWEIQPNEDRSVWREDMAPTFGSGGGLPDNALDQVRFEAPALSINATHWLVTASPEAGDFGFAELRLLHDGLFGDDLVDRYILFLWKDKTISDLSIEAMGSPDPVAPGETLFYTVRVANNGPDGAEDVRLHALHTLGEGLVFKGATASNQSLSCDTGSQFKGPVCELGTLGDGEIVEATLEFGLEIRLTEGENVRVGFAAEPAPIINPVSRITDIFQIPQIMSELASLDEEERLPQEDPELGNNSTEVTTGVRAPDRDALVAIYNAMGGPNWGQQRNWLSEEPLEDWYGVSTDEYGRVTGLDLYYVGLRGPLPPAIGDLPYLEELIIAQNAGLSGTMPPALGKLANLRKLYIGGTKLEGPIPEELTNLTNLQELWLHNNNLSGQIPTGLSGLIGLRVLRLSGNDFTGCLPAGLPDVADNDLDALGLSTCEGTVMTTPTGPAFARNPALDFVFPPGDDDPQDLWSDGTTLWVSDTSAGKIFAYNLENREQEIGNNFEMLSAAGNNSPTGIWSDGTTMWVADASEKRIYAYRMDTKERDAENDFDTLIGAGNESPGGLWSDGTTMWVVDTGDSTIYAYDLDSTDHIAGGDIEVRAYYKWPSDVNIRRLSPFGIWSNNTTLWVSMWVAGTGAYFSQIAAYDMTTKARDSEKDIAILSAAGNHNPRGIWSDDATMWVVDWHDGKVYAYNLETRERQAEKDVYSLNAIGGNNPRDLWSDGTTAWVADYSDEKIYAYNLETMKREPRKDLNNLVPPSGRDPPRGIWSDGTTMRVAYWGYTSGATNAFRDYPSLHGYQMYADVPGASGTFIDISNFYNDHPSGMWSNGTTMWVADSSDGKLYAYALETKQRDADKDFETLRDAGNSNPLGIWSDTATMWVADSSDGKLYAYALETKQRDADKDFETLRDAGNSNPLGIWSDGRTMWVVDDNERRIYAYNMPP